MAGRQRLVDRCDRAAEAELKDRTTRPVCCCIYLRSPIIRGKREMSSMLTLLFSLLFVCVWLPLQSEAHARWKCPLPRDEKDDNGKHIRFDNTGT